MNVEYQGAQAQRTQPEWIRQHEVAKKEKTHVDMLRVDKRKHTLRFGTRAMAAGLPNREAPSISGRPACRAADYPYCVC